MGLWVSSSPPSISLRDFILCLVGRRRGKGGAPSDVGHQTHDEGGIGVGPVELVIGDDESGGEVVEIGGQCTPEPEKMKMSWGLIYGLGQGGLISDDRRRRR